MRDEYIEPAMYVVVAYGGEVPVCYMGKVVQRADNGAWWIDIYLGAGQTLPQMFMPVEILGVPSVDMMTSAGVDG